MYFSFEKGEAFEKYVKTVLFPEKDYDLMHETPSFKDNQERFNYSTLDPDFKFRCKNDGRIFFIEAKYRSNTFRGNDILELTQEQFDRYTAWDKEHPVFIAVGLSWSAGNPEDIALVPLTALDNLVINKTLFDNYHIKRKNPVSPGKLEQLVLLRDSHSTQKNTEKEIPQKVQPNQTLFSNYKILIGIAAIILVAVIFTSWEFLKSSPSNNAEERVKQQISNYYEAIQHNNVEVLDYYINPVVDRWYDNRNVPLQFIKTEADKYYQKYPNQKTEILWNTLQVTKLPNEDYEVSYEMNYEVLKKSTDEVKQFHLKIMSIWTKDLKIKSMYEKKL